MTTYPITRVYEKQGWKPGKTIYFVDGCRILIICSNGEISECASADNPHEAVRLLQKSLDKNASRKYTESSRAMFQAEQLPGFYWMGDWALTQLGLSEHPRIIRATLCCQDGKHHINVIYRRTDGDGRGTTCLETPEHLTEFLDYINS